MDAFKDRGAQDREALEALAAWRRYLWASFRRDWPLFLALWLVNLAVLIMSTVFDWKLP